MDRIQLIDDSVKKLWLDTYVPTVTGSASYFSASRRALGALASERDADTERLPIPRVSLMRLSVAGDPDRQRNGRIRKVAYHDETLTRIYSSPMPLPVNITYQVDFWTRKMSEMNRWIIQFHTDFQLQMKYIKIEVDEFFRNKWVGLRNEGDLEDNSDLEPGEDRPVIRQTSQIVAETWIFPTPDMMRSDPTIKEMTLELEDENENDLGTITAT